MLACHPILPWHRRNNRIGSLQSADACITADGKTQDNFHVSRELLGYSLRFTVYNDSIFYPPIEMVYKTRKFKLARYIKYYSTNRT